LDATVISIFGVAKLETTSLPADKVGQVRIHTGLASHAVVSEMPTRLGVGALEREIIQ
jgi:hypothetical protein